MAIDWKDEIVERLRKLWTDGLSASQIEGALAAEFPDLQQRITRSAVIGKIHRLGLVRSSSINIAARRAGSRKAAERARAAAKPRPFAPAKPAPKQAAQSKLTGLFTSGDNLPKEPLPKDESPSDYAKLYTLDELEAHQCKWFIGDPLIDGGGFCGDKRVEGLPYCTRHSLRAFRAPEPRVRKPTVVRIPTIADLEKV